MENNYDAIDIYQSLMPLVAQGTWYWRATDGLFCRALDVQENRSPWIYQHSNRNNDCNFCGMMFDQFGMLPTKAMDCYKVVVVPETVKQLVQLYELQKRMGLQCKAGCEPRDDVDRNYGGYYYTDSLSGGLECLDIVREAVAREIGNIDVYLKRACTQYERKFGDSDKWFVDPGQKEFEEKVRSMLVPEPTITTQGTELHKSIIFSWLKFAYSRGDNTYLEFTGKPIYPKYVRYERCQS